MKIFIFGNTGMLGSYVTTYLKKRNFNVSVVPREAIDAENVNSTKLSIWFSLNGGLHVGDVVINCIGLIKQKIKEGDSIKAIKINSVFPHVLNDYCKERFAGLIHISTDCCFSGKKGSYTEEDMPDPEDIYGMSKVAGEPLSCTVIRTSVIGEESSKRSLMEWTLSQEGSINGFVNHYWNGVTCLQLAKEIERIIESNSFWAGIRHYYGETVTKAQLVKAIIDTYDNPNNVIVKDVNSPVAVNRTLSSIYSFNPPPGIIQQLQEQREFIRKV